MEGENYMKKRGRVLILLITAALAIEPLQLVYAEPAVDNLTGTVSQETGAEIRDENESAQPEPKPGWVSVEKGYQWRQEDGSFLQQSGWVTIQGKKYYLQKGGIRYSGWQTFKQKKRYYLSNGVLASKRWVKDNGQFYYIRKNGTPVPAGRWLTVKGRKYYIGKKGYRVTGLKTIHNKKYYFNSKGVLIRNKISYKIKGKEYEINSDGVAIRVSSLKAECMRKAKKFVEKHTSPNMSNSQKFRICFNYLMGYTDFKPWINPTDAEYKTQTWPYQSAIYMFDNNLAGSCYGIASAVAACARVLGYEPYVIATTGDHGFVMIDGLYYDNMGPLFGASTHFAYSVRSKVKF